MDQEMDMIAQEDVGREMDVGEADVLGALGGKSLAIGIVVEDHRAAVAVADDMV